MLVFLYVHRFKCKNHEYFREVNIPLLKRKAADENKSAKFQERFVQVYHFANLKIREQAEKIQMTRF